MIREALEALVARRNLSLEEAAQVMEEIMSGQATPAQLAAFVTALRFKGETAAEIAGMARVMRAHATPVRVPFPVLDIVGTGGDASGTFNISTGAAIVAAACGLKVAKHGNRAMTSRCGSADVLEALGVKIDLGPEGVRRCLEEVGIGFMFAPLYHPAMKHAAGPRREIGIRTVFNILGPLTNPAGAQAQVIGVASSDLAPRIARVLKTLGSRHSLVVHAEDGLDEISIGAPTLVYEVRKGRYQSYTLRPEDFGVPRAPSSELKGGTIEENASILRQVLEGRPGPPREVVLLNAAAGLVAADKAMSLQEGYRLAAEAINSGQALHLLEKWARLSQSLG